jgi:hypothetical protein
MENYSKGKINKKLKKKRSVKHRTYTKEKLVEAVARAKNGETAYKHGIAFEMPVNTIVNKAQGVNGVKARSSNRVQ